MTRVKEVHQRTVVSFGQPDFQLPHEPAGGEPEVIADQHDCLNMLTIAMAKSGDQLRVRLASPRMKPLLELVQDQQHLVVGCQDAPRRKFASESTRPNP